MEDGKRDELIRRLSAAMRAVTLYSAAHPLVMRSLDLLTTVCRDALQSMSSVVIGFIGEEIVINDAKLPKSRTSLVGFARLLRERGIDKVTIVRGVTRDEFKAFVIELSEQTSPTTIASRLAMRGVRHILVGHITIDETATSEAMGIAAAKKVYENAARTAEVLWNTARAGEKPDPGAARSIIDSLAKLVTQDRTSLLALTALKKYDNYTFTHMVNVSILSMAQARSLNIDGSMLREFGVSALMHDIGKVYTPDEVLNKPDVLTKEEFAIMKRHVIDGAQILRGTPEMPALAPVVAFEHHLKQDLSGYPENIAARKLNLCTMVVSISDVYDALRSKRTYREGLATDRIRAIMGRKNDVSFNQKLLRRFINLVGLYPIGTLVRLNTNELAVVTHEHPTDPFRPQVRIVRDRDGGPIEQPPLANTWEREPGKDYPRAIVEAVDAAPLGLEPLQYL